MFALDTKAVYGAWIYQATKWSLAHMTQQQDSGISKQANVCMNSWAITHKSTLLHLTVSKW